MISRPALYVGAALVVVAVALSAWAYPHVPEMIPTHWAANGQVNGYSPKIVGVWMMPAILAFVWFLMLVLPRISPKGYSMRPSLTVFYIVILGVMALLATVHALVLKISVSTSPTMPNITAIVLGLVGALFVLIGNYLPKVQKNFFLGIRTPWTLASDEVWLRTHRFGGWLFTLGGLALIFGGIFGAAYIVVPIVILMVIAPFVYSYVAYKRVEGFDT